MRVAITSVILGACFFFAPTSSSQSPCKWWRGSHPSDNPRLTASEGIHRNLQNMPREVFRDLANGDIAYILKCASPRDAAMFFAGIKGTRREMPNVLVLTANPQTICVRWRDKPPLDAFCFNFGQKLNAVPEPGTNITIAGTFASYARDPFLITMTDAAISPSSTSLSATEPPTN